MISWMILSKKNEILDQSPRIPEVKEWSDLAALFDDNYFTQIGRTLKGESYEVIAWQPFHQIVLTKDLIAKTYDDETKLSRDQFWSAVPKLINDTIGEYQNQFTNDELIRTFQNRTIDLRSFFGYYGYLSFEISRIIEKYNHRDDDSIYPYLILEFPSKLLITHNTFSIYIEIDITPISNPEIILTSPPQVKVHESLIHHSTSYQTYIKDINTIINHINQGNIYQANYTQQFNISVPSGNLFSIFQKIKTDQHLPYAAFLNYGKNFKVVSLSPELFLHISSGIVMTKPIKGTISRGKNEEQDNELKTKLIKSTKDQAELAMIVDLLRNDLGKSANSGSVTVEKHAEIETYENVHHLVSTISAIIDTDLASSWRLLLRAFPGGSISGVPKLRSLEIIEELEKIPRGIYTGNIGFIGINGDLELNIAIRTAVQVNEIMSFNAGGGIVYDSEPVSEYLETLHKAKHLAKYFNHTFTGHIVYCNGNFEVIDHIKFEMTNDGIFETMLVESGKIKNLEYHIQRFNRGLEILGFETIVFPNNDILNTLFELNLASSSLIKLNLYVWRSDNNEEHFLVKVQDYKESEKSIQLLIGSEIKPPKSIEIGLKSLDYDKYREATENAKSEGYWDSILYSNNNLILEGGRSTLYFFKDGIWKTPKLGVVQGTIRQKLLDHNMVNSSNIILQDVKNFDVIAISNALIGLQLVQSITQENVIIWQIKNINQAQVLIDELNDKIS